MAEVGAALIQMKHEEDVRNRLHCRQEEEHQMQHAKMLPFDDDDAVLQE